MDALKKLQEEQQKREERDREMLNRMEERRRKGGRSSQDTDRAIVVPGEGKRGGDSSSGTGWSSVFGSIAELFNPGPGGWSWL